MFSINETFYMKKRATTRYLFDDCISFLLLNRVVSVSVRNLQTHKKRLSYAAGNLV
jgi:hypothetical protein